MKTNSRRSVAVTPHDHDLRLRAKQALKYPAVKFTGRQALAVAEGFRIAINEAKYSVHACAILPDHVHMVVKRCDRDIETVVQHLKSRATMQLNSQGLHPLQNIMLPTGSSPTPWIKRCWKVFLHDETEIDRAIRYVENNPLKEGKRRQKWSFVTPCCSSK